MASKVVVGVAIGCGVIMLAGIAVIGIGGWYVKKKVTDKVNSVTSSNKASELWSDVPRIDGLQPSDMDIPLGVKVVAQPILNRVLGEGTHSGDWIVFTTTKTPSEIKAFYENDRMTSFGNWAPSKNSTCFTPDSQMIPQVSLFCVYEKKKADRQTGLAIFTGPYERTKPITVFFLRVEGPIQNQTTSTTVTKETPRVISVLNGTAPYGIEKRPMPAGLNLDELLPKQVGPYTRTMIEMSTQRGVAPSSIDIDGNSIYATYRSDDNEIFVEFAVSSTAANAQATLDTAANETLGQFPTDPNVGSIGTEPSYLKMKNESGAFFAWTRSGYYFSANAKSGEQTLDAFMQAFPY